LKLPAGLLGVRVKPTLERTLRQMRDDWDTRARKNALYYVHNGTKRWTDDEFFASGELTAADWVSSDMNNICQGSLPGTLRVLEIGCGVGRVTRALAKIFGEVHGVDVSGEMARLARKNLAGVSNAFIYQNNGKDVSDFPANHFDFAFSTIVFQ